MDILFIMKRNKGKRKKERKKEKRNKFLMKFDSLNINTVIG